MTSLETTVAVQERFEDLLKQHPREALRYYKANIDEVGEGVLNIVGSQLMRNCGREDLGLIRKLAGLFKPYGWESYIPLWATNKLKNAGKQ